MVKIRIDMNALELRMQGHANSDRHGKDLVCCALSILTETLSRYLERMLAEGQIYNLREEIEPGDVYIQAEPWGWSRKDTWVAFNVIREGMRALAKGNEKFIEMKEE